MMWGYGDIKDRVTWGTSNTQHEKCSWLAPMKKILLFISDWYFDLAIGTLEGFLQISNLLKTSMADLHSQTKFVKLCQGIKQNWIRWETLISGFA